jgi:RHS repeat-associated protein
VTYAYDDAYRLTLEDCVPAGGSYRKAYRFKYEFDGVGNRTKLRYYNGSSTSTYTFEYSARNELTLMNDGTYDYQYSYDTRGNLVEKYVDQGEQYGIRITTYGWDAQDHLVSVDDELWQNDYLSWSWSVDYKYDHAGRRVAKSVNGGAWRWYFYDGLKVVAEGTSSSDKQYYTTAPGDPGGIICRDSTAGTNPLYYHYDRLGNVMAVSDSNGAPYALYTMGAFGYVLEKGTSTGYSSEHATDPQPYHLTTKEYDNDVGLYYFNARWYDLWTGRFVSRAVNPVYVEHPYVIAENRPLYFVDTTGLEYTYCDCEKACYAAHGRHIMQAQAQYTTDLRLAASSFRSCAEQAHHQLLVCAVVACYAGSGGGMAGCLLYYAWSMNGCVDTHTADMAAADQRFQTALANSRREKRACILECEKAFGLLPAPFALPEIDVYGSITLPIITHIAE